MKKQRLTVNNGPEKGVVPGNLRQTPWTGRGSPCPHQHSLNKGQCTCEPQQINATCSTQLMGFPQPHFSDTSSGNHSRSFGIYHVRHRTLDSIGKWPWPKSKGNVSQKYSELRLVSQHGDHQKSTYSTSADVMNLLFSNKILMDLVASNIFPVEYLVSFKNASGK